MEEVLGNAESRQSRTGTLFSGNAPPRSVLALTSPASSAWSLSTSLMRCQGSSPAVETGSGSAWPRSVCRRLSLSEMPHFANEVSRIYKMWACSANLKNPRAMIIQKRLIILVLGSELRHVVGELKTWHFSSLCMSDVSALVKGVMPYDVIAIF